MIKGTINLQNETLLLCARSRSLPANQAVWLSLSFPPAELFALCAMRAFESGQLFYG